MYPPMEMDNGTYYPKPMNCPMHCLIYRSRQRSYRELPLRLFELGTVYRYERAGTLHGLHADPRLHPGRQPHLLHRGAAAGRDRVAARLRACRVLRAFGFDDFQANLSTKDPEKYVGSRRDLGEGDRRAARRARAVRPRVQDQGGRRRVLRPEDRHRRARRHRPHAGSCRRSSATSTCPSGSTSSTSAPTTPATGRSCCTGRCSVRSSGSSVCSSSTTPARSRRGWRRCRPACSRSPRPTRSTPRRSSQRLQARRVPGRPGRGRRPARQAHPHRQAGEAALRARGRRRRRRQRHARRQPARRRGRARRAARRLRRAARAEVAVAERRRRCR